MLANYDYDQINPNLSVKVENATKEIDSSFGGSANTMQAMISKSSAIVPLFLWINSFKNYY